MIQAINATNSHHFRKEISKHKSYEKSPFCQKEKRMFDNARQYASSSLTTVFTSILATNPTCDLGKRNSLNFSSLIHKNTSLSQKVPEQMKCHVQYVYKLPRKMFTTLDDSNFRGYFSRSIF